MQSISPEETIARASKIKLVLTDVDGTLTDTGVYYSSRGEELKRFSIRDGMGMEILRDHGIETAMITRENSACVESRSRKLKLPFLFMGVWDKLDFLPALLTQTSLTTDQLAYFGDDVNDLDIMRAISSHGLVGCPSDGMPAIKDIVHFRASVGGGHGAFRDFAEWILANKRSS